MLLTEVTKKKKNVKNFSFILKPTRSHNPAGYATVDNTL